MRSHAPWLSTQSWRATNLAPTPSCLSSHSRRPSKSSSRCRTSTSCKIRSPASTVTNSVCPALESPELTTGTGEDPLWLESHVGSSVLTSGGSRLPPSAMLEDLTSSTQSALSRSTSSTSLITLDGKVCSASAAFGAFLKVASATSTPRFPRSQPFAPRESLSAAKPASNGLRTAIGFALWHPQPSSCPLLYRLSRQS